MNVGLEEVEYDHEHDEWRITVGFSRPWQTSNFLVNVSREPIRSYKVVTISNKDSRVVSVKNREVAG